MKRTFVITLLSLTLILLCSCKKGDEATEQTPQSEPVPTLTSAPEDKPVAAPQDKPVTASTDNPVEAPQDKPVAIPTDETLTSTDAPFSNPLIPEGLKAAKWERQDFSTLVPDECSFYADDEDGLYIETLNETGIPYVLIYRYANMPIDGSQFLEESIYPGMLDLYGNNMISVSEKEIYDIGGKQLPGMLFTYKVNNYTINSLRLCETIGSSIVNYTMKTVADSDEDITGFTYEVLEDAIRYFVPDMTFYDLKRETADIEKDIKKLGGYTFTPSETSQLSYEEYSDPSGYFSVTIPRGWKVQLGYPEGNYDLISYTLKIYDPQKPDRALFYCMNSSGYAKSAESKRWHQTYYPDTPFALLPCLNELTTEGYFTALNDFYEYRGFRTIENLGGSVFGGDILLGRAVSTITGNNIEGLFTAYVTASSQPVQNNLFDITQGFTDAGFVTAYSIISETAGEEEFPEWQPVFESILSSLTFTDLFNRDRSKAWAQLLGTSYEIARNADEMSNIISDSWNYRNTSEDISSQKRSDATLGYERIYDNETGEIYKIRNGFSDGYHGERYTPATDAQYLLPVTGTVD